MPRALAAAARYVIGCLDDNGYLKADPEQMRAKAGACDALLERAIALVQSFDPPGVGARDLAECLCLQIPASDALARRLARDFCLRSPKNVWASCGENRRVCRGGGSGCRAHPPA